MRLPATLCLVLAAIASLRAEAPPVEGTLPEDYLPGLRPLLKEAVERSPNTIMASISLAQAEGNRYQNASQLWPQLSLNSNYAMTKETVQQGATSTDKGLFYSANLSQPIFQWGAYKNQAEIGSLGQKIAERQYADAYRSLATLIREQYMGLIGKKIVLRNARFQKKISEEQLAAQHARFEAGSVSEAELQGFNMNLDDATLSADRAEEDFAYAKQVFIRLVGIEALSDDAIPLEVPHPQYSEKMTDAILTGFVGEGVESTFQSEVYQMLVKQQDLSYSIAKVRLLPKVSGAAGYSYNDVTEASPGAVTQVGVRNETFSIGANWPLFDGLATRGAKLSALSARRLYERQRKTYIDSTIDSMTYMRHQIGFSWRAMGMAEVHNALIEAEVKRIGEDKNLGYASQATIDAGILNLDSTQYLMANARADYLGRWTEFISLAGIDPALSNISSRYVR